MGTVDRSNQILFQKNWPATKLARQIDCLEPQVIANEYDELRRSAPKRHSRNKSYFVGHTGYPSTKEGKNSTRREEHLAIALCNSGEEWPRPNGDWLKMLDYQVPLKARQSDCGIGKIDILGVTKQGQLIIHELKVVGKDGSPGDAPVTALMEGLRYAACVQANIVDISKEAHDEYDIEVSHHAPIVQVLAPEDWWNAWFNCEAAGNWTNALSRLSDELTDRIGVPIEYAALNDVKLEMGPSEKKPRLDKVPGISIVNLNG